MGLTIGLIGDYNPSVQAHQAIPLALRRAAESVGVELRWEWIPTTEIQSASRVASYDGLWCVPASPYASMEGALFGIRYARENKVPFLGTCGGFQHAVIEYARNGLGWTDAEHAETVPDAPRAVISMLECSLLEVNKPIRLFPGTRIAAAYGAGEAHEGYHCRFGINPRFRAALTEGSLRPSAEDPNGELRAVELEGHPFFVATLFQPERAALRGEAAPLVTAFVQAVATAAA